MARSFIVALALVGLASGGAVPAGDERVCSVEDGCEPEKGTSALQMSRTAAVSRTEIVEDDSAVDDIYAGLAEVLAGREERPAEDLAEAPREEDFAEDQSKDIDLIETAKSTEDVRKCVCGEAKFHGDATVKQWRGIGCNKVFAWPKVAQMCAVSPDSEPIQFLKSQCCEMSGGCLCDKGEAFRGDAEIPHWKGKTCKPQLAWACVAEEPQSARQYVKHMCCGGPKGCGSELCPAGSELLPDKTSHAAKGNQFSCKIVAWWFKYAAPKDKCAVVRKQFLPTCCRKEGYGSNTDK